MVLGQVFSSKLRDLGWLINPMVVGLVIGGGVF